MINPHLTTSTLLFIFIQSRCEDCDNEGCDYRKRQRRGSIRLFVDLMIRKIQKKKERKMITINLSDERVSEM